MHEILHARKKKNSCLEHFRQENNIANMVLDAASVSVAPRLIVLLLSDIVGSVQFKMDLGTEEYAKVLARHNELFGMLIEEFSGGRILQNTGDGFLASFKTPSDAVLFALRFQSLIGIEAWYPRKIECRIGIHLGEIRSVDPAPGAPSDDHIVGLAIDLASRVMSLGCGGQILLTRPVFDDARQYVRELSGTSPEGPALKWLNHGPYSFKGAEDPFDVCEVGIEDSSPLHPPADSEKARRVVPHEQEEMFGPGNPRPSAGFRIPNKPNWRLVRRIGEGGFGEVWLGEHSKLKDQRVFKFCFNADRLYSLKREYTLFRLLKEALGDRDDIARLHEYNLERPPFYLESEFTNGGSLITWAESIGGIGNLELEARLELLWKVADAVAAAHSVGILHKDLKPSNILIQTEPGGAIQPRIADFGIGLLADRSTLLKLNVTETGFTEINELAEGGSSRTGTRMYAPPESVTNQPYTTAGDVYALGVLYYQLAVGDLSRPLAEGWRTDIDDETLRQDIARCVDRDPAKRPAGAGAVAEMVRTIEKRRNARAAEILAEQRSVRRARRMRIARGAVCGALVLLALSAAGVIYHVHNLHVEQARTRAAMEEEKMVTEFAIDDIFASMTPENAPDPKVRDQFVESIMPAVNRVGDRFKERPTLEAAVRYTIGRTFAKLDRREDAALQFKLALDIRRKVLGENHRDTLAALESYAMVVRRLKGRIREAEQLVSDALERRTRAFGLDDPDRLESLHDRGVLLKALFDLKGAESSLREAWDRRKKVLGDQNPDTINSLANYALVLNDLGGGKDPRALELLKEAVDYRRKFLGPEDPQTIKALWQYALILNMANRSKEAEPFAKEAVDASRKLYGNRHGILMPLNAYVVVLNQIRRADLAESIGKEALDLAKTMDADATHPDTIQIASNYVIALNIRLSDLTLSPTDRGRIATECATTLDLLRRLPEAAEVRKAYRLKTPTTAPKQVMDRVQ